MPLHVRSSSAGIDSKAFREAIARMRQEVLESRAETQRIQDQLNCLILLIKRSWKGDKGATLHVSNIVGMSPPSSLMDDRHRQDCKIYSPGKSRAINHWAMLSLGLLNKHYKELEVHALDRAKARLESRMAYLEEQLAYHRDLLVIHRTTSANVDNGHFFLTEQHKKNKNVQDTSSKVRRPASGKSNTTLTGNEQGRPPTDMLDFILNTNPRPKTFCKPELFDGNKVLGERQKPKRPLSGHLQRKADSTRARPSSAVVLKGDRPLKSETTRPISTGNLKGQRSKSAKVRGSESNYNKSYINPTLSTVKVDTRNLHQKNLLLSDDLKKMELMEEEFTKTTKLLQEKLGIRDGSVI
ncbi:uncharacterized protein [Antedon mediterranea]|uniref:uncharacterized protein n=1 Tax=Antedon mediterranea TaxID=105859 RepID=UPI003AF6EB4C